MLKNISNSFWYVHNQTCTMKLLFIFWLQNYLKKNKKLKRKKKEKKKEKGRKNKIKKKKEIKKERQKERKKERKARIKIVGLSVIHSRKSDCYMG